jgi:hypothetical protein
MEKTAFNRHLLTKVESVLEKHEWFVLMDPEAKFRAVDKALQAMFEDMDRQKTEGQVPRIHIRHFVEEWAR